MYKSDISSYAGGIEDDLCRELLGRQYKRSVYKSLAEYDLIFENFFDEEKQKIKRYFQVNLNSTLPRVKEDEENTAGYLKKQQLNEMKQCAGRNNLKAIKQIKNLVFVAAAYKSKAIDPHKTLILIGNRIVAMEEIPILKDRCSLNQRKTSHYFYLYFETEGNTADDAELADEMKQLLKIFFEALKKEVTDYEKNRFTRLHPAGRRICERLGFRSR